MIKKEQRDVKLAAAAVAAAAASKKAARASRSIAFKNAKKYSEEYLAVSFEIQKFVVS